MSVIQFPKSDLPHDFPCDGEPRAFHASHGLSEAFINSRALDSAHGIYAWVGICFAIDAALIAAGMWVFG